MAWKKDKFKNIIKHKSGYTWSKNQETKFPEPKTVRVLTVTNVQKELDLSSELYLRDVKETDKVKKAVSKHWSIAVSSNGNRKRIGNAVYIKEDSEYLFASFLTAFKPKEDSDILPKYFFRWLKSHPIQERITAVSEGTTGLGNLDIRFLRNMDIEYPENSSEQIAIDTILSKVDEIIEATKNSIKAAEKLKKALIQNLLTGKLKPDGTWRTEDDFYEDEKYGKVPIGWNFGTLNDIAEIIAGQSPTGDTYNDEGKGTPMLNGPTEFTDYFPVPVQYTTKPTKICEIGDILFTVRGSSTGRMNFANIEYCIGRGIAAIRAKENSHIDFLYYTLVTIAHKILAEAKGAGSTFPNVNRGELRKKKIIFPNQENEQKEIGEIIRAVQTTIQRKETKIKTLQRLKKSLMQNLLTGKVRLPEEFIAQFENELEEVNTTTIS